MSDRYGQHGDLGDRLRQWMAVEAGDAPVDLVDDVMDAVLQRRLTRPKGWRVHPFVAAVARYGALTAAVAAGVALGLWISTASLRPDRDTGASPVPSAFPSGAGVPLPRGALRTDDSVSISGRLTTVGASGLWYEAADGAGIGLLRGGAGEPVVFAIWGAEPTDVGPRVGDMVEAFGSVWVVDDLAGELLRVDPVSGEVAATLTLGPGRVAAGSAAIWYLTADGLLSVDPASDEAVTVVPGVGQADGSVVVAGGSVWVSNGDELLEIDEVTAELRQRMDFHVSRLAVGGGAVWGLTSLELIRIDVTTDELTRRQFAQIDTPMESAVDLAWGDDRLMLVIEDRGNDDVIQVAYPSWTVLDRTSFARQNDGIAVGLGAVWVATDPDGRIWRMVPTP